MVRLVLQKLSQIPVRRVTEIASNSRSPTRSASLAKIKGMSALTTVEERNGHLHHPDNVILLTSTNFEALSKQGAEVLKSGGVIGVPTDTVYGIASDAQNNRAIERIYEIKGRDCRKPIAICVHSIDQVYHWGKVKVPHALLEELLPGPVTLVFERQAILNPNLNPSTTLIGIRIPDNRFIVNLAKFHGGPVALTSANLSASPSTLEVEEFQNLWPSLDFIFNGGRLSACEESEKAARAGSTVIDLSQEGSFRIIREGTAHADCVQTLKDKYSFRELI